MTETDPVTNRNRRIKVPLFVRYQRILDLKDKMPPDNWRKHKIELFGSDTEVFAPERYNELELVTKRLKIDLLRWDLFDIDRQAQLIAQVQLATIVDIVRRHDEIIRDNTRKQQEKADAKAKAAAKKNTPRRRR